VNELVISTFVVLFVVIDPIGLSALFGALTFGGSDAYRRRMAIKGSAVAAVTLVFFALAGSWTLHQLGIGMPAFRIAGGLLLFLLAIDMVFARQTGLRSTTRREQQEAEHKEDISVFPLGIPLIAGPGSMTTVVLLVGDHRGDWVDLGVILGLLAVVMLITCLSLLATARLMRVLGETGANVVGRVLGVVLAALAVQYVIDGIHAVLPRLAAAS